LFSFLSHHLFYFISPLADLLALHLPCFTQRHESKVLTFSVVYPPFWLLNFDFDLDFHFDFDFDCETFALLSNLICDALQLKYHNGT